MNCALLSIKMLVLCFLLGLCCGSKLQATTVLTPASRATLNLTYSIEKFVASGGVASAVTFADILSYFLPEAEYHLAQGKLSDRFELLANRSVIEATTQRKLILVTSNEIYEDRRSTNGRYAIWEKEGKILMEWVPEERFRKIMEAAGLPYINKGLWKQPDTRHLSSQWLPSRQSWDVWGGMAAVAFALAAAGWFLARRANQKAMPKNLRK